MSVPAHQPERFCRNCWHSLRGLRSAVCPECGQGFDPADPRTTLAHPRRPVWDELATIYRVLAVICAGLELFAVAYSAVGLDPMLLAFIMMLLLPALLLTLLGSALPPLPLGWRMRALGAASLLTIVSVFATYWQFRLTMLVHRPFLKPIAERVRQDGTNPLPGRTGLFHYRQVRLIEEGNVGFQFTGGAGGGVYLVKRAPGAGRVWYNTNWEYALGRDWCLVYED